MLPPLAPFPPASVRKNISPDVWESCLQCWTLLVQANLRLSLEEFRAHVSKKPSVVEFTISYITESAQSSSHSESKVEKEKGLRREIFLLTHRIFTEVIPIPPQVLQHGFLGDLSIVYGRYGTTKNLLKSLWDRENLDESSTMRDNKRSLIQLLDYSQQAPASEVDRVLLRTVALLKVSFQYGQFLMLGSDVLDALAIAFEKGSSSYQSKIMIIGYLSLVCLLETRKPRISTLLDHLYSLQSTSLASSLLRTTASSTPLLRQLREKLSGHEFDRAQALMQELEAFENTTAGMPRDHVPRKISKGKYKDLGDNPLNDMHVHKMSLVTQIQDLFPDLGSAFIVKLLEEYSDDTEQVVGHLLEDSLPTHLRQTDRTEDLSHQAPQSPPKIPVQENLPLRTRRNIHDNDAFDRLAIPASSLTQGRSSTSEATLPPRPSPSAKAAILSALAAFDSDSDERDDTYDATDVGGTVDSALPGTSDDIDTDGNGPEEALFQAFKATPTTFDRDANTRRGPARAALKRDTGMTDEAIEGWAIMLHRDPRRIRRLETRFSTFTGAQRELPSSSYRADSATEDSDVGGAPQGRGLGPGRGQGPSRGRGRGRGGGGRGRGGGGAGGDVAGPADDRGTQIARQRKDAQKGSRANHNRRDQRARKMARGGGMAG